MEAAGDGSEIYACKTDLVYFSLQLQTLRKLPRRRKCHRRQSLQNRYSRSVPSGVGSWQLRGCFVARLLFFLGICRWQGHELDFEGLLRVRIA